jgi:hypothetical protein
VLGGSGTGSVGDGLPSPKNRFVRLANVESATEAFYPAARAHTRTRSRSWPQVRARNRPPTWRDISPACGAFAGLSNSSVSDVPFGPKLSNRQTFQIDAELMQLLIRWYIGAAALEDDSVRMGIDDDDCALRSEGCVWLLSNHTHGEISEPCRRFH